MRKAYYALFVVTALVLSVWLVIHYDVLTLARAFLAPAARWLAVAARFATAVLWQAAPVVSQPLLKKYLFRRVSSPVWRLAMRAAMVVVGHNIIARLYREMQMTRTRAHHARLRWKAQHRALRWSISSGLVFAGGLVGLGLYIFPVWVPLSGTLVQRVQFWWMDRIVNRWVAPRRQKFRRLMRTHPFWRVVRQPHRRVVYWVMVGMNRSARRVRGTFAAPWWRAGNANARNALGNSKTAGTGTAAA
jgi:hypothetical protein